MLTLYTDFRHGGTGLVEPVAIPCTFLHTYSFLNGNEPGCVTTTSSNTMPVIGIDEFPSNTPGDNNGLVMLIR